MSPPPPAPPPSLLRDSDDERACTARAASRAAASEAVATRPLRLSRRPLAPLEPVLSFRADDAPATLVVLAVVVMVGPAGGGSACADLSTAASSDECVRSKPMRCSTSWCVSPTSSLARRRRATTLASDDECEASHAPASRLGACSAGDAPDESRRGESRRGESRRALRLLPLGLRSALKRPPPLGLRPASRLLRLAPPAPPLPAGRTTGAPAA